MKKKYHLMPTLLHVYITFIRSNYMPIFILLQNKWRFTLTNYSK